MAHVPGHKSVRDDQYGHLGDRVASAAATLALLASAKAARDGQEKRPELRGELHLAAFSRLYGRPRLLYCARRSRHARTRARASLQRRFRTGMHQSLLIYASREQHRVCSG